jgi:hypothetical protein
MRILNSLSLMLLLLFACSVASGAEIGSLQEAIQCAENNQRPDYLQKIKEALSEKIIAFALKNNIY